MMRKCCVIRMLKDLPGIKTPFFWQALLPEKMSWNSSGGRLQSTICGRPDLLELFLFLKSDLVLFWIPRHQTQLPGRVTNTELGFMAGRACANPERFKYSFVWGYPRDAWKVKSEHHWVSEIAGIEPLHDLNELCIEAVRLLGDK